MEHKALATCRCGWTPHTELCDVVGTQTETLRVRCSACDRIMRKTVDRNQPEEEREKAWDKLIEKWNRKSTKEGK